MEVVRSRDDARPLVEAHKKMLKARPLIEPGDAISAIRQSKVLTEDQVNQLELCPTFQTQDYIIFLVSDTSGNEPKLVLWAYAEKLRDNSGFLLSYGTGSTNSVMKIRACAKLTFDSALQSASYEFGGELNDDGDEITFKSKLDSEQFASSMTEIVNVDGGGRTRLAIASTEDHLQGLHEEGGQHSTAEDFGDEMFADDGGGDT